MNTEYDVYVAASAVSNFCELPHERIGNGIIVKNVFQDGEVSSYLQRNIKSRLGKMGYTPSFKWTNYTTVRITWHK